MGSKKVKCTNNLGRGVSESGEELESVINGASLKSTGRVANGYIFLALPLLNFVFLESIIQKHKLGPVYFLDSSKAEPT